MTNRATLNFTAQQAGKARDIAFPLHPQTVSAEHVSAVLEAVLAAISKQVEAHTPLSDGDVLQALCMALSIRMHMVDAPLETVQRLVAELLEHEDEAVDQGQERIVRLA